MKVLKFALTAALGAGLLVGCQDKDKGDGDGKALKKDATTKPVAKADAPKVDDKAAKLAKETEMVTKATYNEATRDGRIYVVSTPELAAKYAKGGAPAHSVTKVGYGPKGETVIFEASEGGLLEKKLMAEYNARHKKS